MPQLFRIEAACLDNSLQAIVNATPPEKRVAPKPPNECDIFKGTIIADGIPLPGSREFCHALPQIKAAFKDVVDRMLAWFDQLDPIGMVVDGLSINVDPDNDSTIYQIIANLWNSLISGLGRAAHFSTDWIVSLVRSAVSMFRCLTKQMNPEVSLGIWVIKQLSHMVEKFNLGFNFAAVLEAAVGLNMDFVHRWLDMLASYFAPIEIPGPGEATRAWLLGRIDVEQRDCIWLLHGLDPKTYIDFAETEREQLDWRESMQYARRMQMGDNGEKAFLRSRGFVNPSDVAMAQEMYWELPGIADHLHWLQRQVFDKDYVAKYKLMDGFDAKFWPAFGKDLTALGMREEYARNHYAAHWIMPSPEQMKQFLYRSGEINDETGQPFTLDDFERLLAEQDYNVLARSWFRATAYNVPAISYVKMMFQQNIIGFEQLKEYHRRLGYSPKDAERFSQIDDIQKTRQRASAAGGWMPKTATAAWFAKEIDTDAHTNIFRDLGYTEQEARGARFVYGRTFAAKIAMRARTRSLSTVLSALNAAADVGTITVDQAAKMLTDAGWPKDFADSMAKIQNATAATKQVRQAVSYLRNAVLHGNITLAGAEQELTRLGVVRAAVQRYLATWRLQLTHARKHRSADQIVSDVANAHITTPQAIAMLQNLGYTDADTRLYLADAQAKLIKTEQGRLAAAQKAGLARAKQQDKIAAAATKQRKAIVGAMVKDMPVSKLEKWLKLGIIGKAYFARRMTAYGYSPTEIEFRIKEVCQAKGAACDGQQAGQGNAVQGGGSGGNAKGGSGSGDMGVPK